MKIIIGLGNPGENYARTYHNAGFLAVEALADRLNAQFSKKECGALTAHTEHGGDKVILAKPQTFMNLSGTAAAALAHYYKCPAGDIIVVFDDIDIEKGTVRYRESGSGGTHNGVKDIVLKLGPGFKRIKIGIGRPPPGRDLASFVLSVIPESEREAVYSAAGLAADKIIGLIENWA
jgi:PTH1 family peptidyl-tRNA hydrolase